ncbi:hypothetical protein EV657_1241, partial [Rhodovulum visakhapatnamense]
RIQRPDCHALSRWRHRPVIVRQPEKSNFPRSKVGEQGTTPRTLVMNEGRPEGRSQPITGFTCVITSRFWRDRACRLHLPKFGRCSQRPRLHPHGFSRPGSGGRPLRRPKNRGARNRYSICPVSPDKGQQWSALRTLAAPGPAVTAMYGCFRGSARGGGLGARRRLSAASAPAGGPRHSSVMLHRRRFAPSPSATFGSACRQIHDQRQLARSDHVARSSLGDPITM